MTAFDLYPKLKLLVKNLDRPDLRSVDALLVDLTGDVLAGKMLYHLLLWWPKTAPRGGWLYKSHHDWWAECRVKQTNLPKCNSLLERIGVETAVKRAEGSPTKHYRLNLEHFVAALAKLLGLSADIIFCLFAPNPFEGSNETSENGFFEDKGNSQKSTTEESSKELQKIVVVGEPESSPEQASKAEVREAVQLAQDATPEAEPVPVDLHQFFQSMVTAEFTPYLLRDIDYARFCVQYTKAAEGVKYPQGFAAKQIREDGLKADFEAWRARQIALTRDTPPRPVVSAPPPTPSPLEAETHDGAAEAETAALTQEQEIGAEAQADFVHSGEERAKRETEIVQQSLQGDWQLPGQREQEWWAVAMGQLELQFDRQTYGMYLEGARLLGIRDGTLVIGVRGQHTREWCQWRLYRNVASVVDIVSGQTLALEFVDTSSAAVAEVRHG